MTSQISIKIDDALKKKVQKKAKKDGITLKSLIIFSMKAYLENKVTIGLQNNNPHFEEYEISFDTAQDPQSLLDEIE